MMTDDDSGLGAFFQRYRAACPEIEPGVNFMPGVWQKIEAQSSFPFTFQRLARTMMTASVALCFLLLLLNLVSAPQTHLLAPSYIDALMADHTAEKTDYTEALRGAPPAGETPSLQQQR